MVAPLVIAAGLGLAGSALSAGASFNSAKQASKGQAAANLNQQTFNASEAQKNRDFQERMFSTRYQTTRKDLEAANYNPLIGIPGGITVPAGATASSQPKSATEAASKITSTAAERAAQTAHLQSATYLNTANADLALGRIGIPGFYSGPASSAKDFLNKKSTDAKGAWQAIKNIAGRKRGEKFTFGDR